MAVLVVASDTCYPLTYHARGWLDAAAGTLEIVYPFADPSGLISAWSLWIANADDGAIDLSHLVLPSGSERPINGLTVTGRMGKSFEARWGTGYTKAGKQPQPSHLSPLYFTDANGYAPEDVALIEKLAVGDSAVLDAGNHVVTRLPDCPGN